MFLFTLLGYTGSQGLNNDMAYWVVLMRNLDNKIMMYVPLHIVGLHRFQGLNNDMAYWVVLMRNLDNKIMTAGSSSHCWATWVPSTDIPEQ